uniref:Uncharacterized protein n=1 Tax=viral metagenome TaxID=1070528 RepID=A0A6M3JPR1_9ZZZZ
MCAKVKVSALEFSKDMWEIDKRKYVDDLEKENMTLKAVLEEKDKKITALKKRCEELEIGERTALSMLEDCEGRVLRIQSELNQASQLKRWSADDVRRVGALLDKMGAPKLQESGFPYSIIGRLSALTTQIVGESWAAKIDIQQAEIASLKKRCDEIEDALEALIAFIPVGYKQVVRRHSRHLPVRR